MNSENLEQLEKAFAVAADLSGSERADYVEEFSREHPHLRAQLLQLLEADASATDQWQHSIAQSLVDLSEDFNDPWIGKTLGVYTLKKRIGVGGMSAVFLAERTDDTYAQSVAIKIMSAQLFSSTAIDRFKAERQILASLNHPNIATLIDGGSTEGNLPYLVMEHVSGVSVDRYCDQHALSVVARIQLFQKICAAVDYAHRNLIVHRDIKPSNILIGDDGTPKLLDFGIAKLIDSEVDLNSELTAVNMRVLTPEYASPEQIHNQPISVASDIYSLGVLLFKMLTNHSPYGEKRSSARDLESAILDSDPLKPSSVFSRSSAAENVEQTESTAEIGRLRSTSVSKLRQTLSGDLDNIVIKCLQKEPERRYTSALALAQDLDRFLNNEPVEAHGGDWLYKLRKFSIRQAKLLTTVAIALISLIALTAYYTVQLSQERNQALQAALDAQRAADQAQEVSGFLQSLFESASPVVAQGKDITAADLLDAGVERIDQLADQPVLQAELLRVMGGSYSTIGAKERSLELFERSISTLESTPNVEPVVLAEALLHHSNNLRVGHELESAEEQSRRALALHENSDLEAPYLYAQTLGVLGSTLNDLGRFAEAEEYLLQARDVFMAQPGPPTNDLLLVLSDYANALSSQNRTADALQIFEEITKASDQVAGPLHPDSIVRYGNLAAVARRIGAFARGSTAADEALLRAKEVWTRENPQLMRHMALAASSAANMGEFDGSVELAEQAVSWLSGGPWANSSHDFVARVSLGRLYVQAGEVDKGKLVLKSLLDDARDLLGSDHYLSLAVQITYANALAKKTEHDDAEQLLREVVSYGEGLPRFMLFDAQQSLANTLSLSGKADEANQLYADLIAQLDSSSTTDQPVAIRLLPAASSHYRRTGQSTEALATAERALNWARELGLDEHYLAARALADAALASAALGEQEVAAENAQEALARLSNLFPNDDEQVEALRILLDTPGTPTTERPDQ